MKVFKKTIHKNNKPMLEWIVDLKEELIDALVYLKKIEKIYKQSKPCQLKTSQINGEQFFQFLVRNIGANKWQKKECLWSTNHI